MKDCWGSLHVLIDVSSSSLQLLCVTQGHRITAPLVRLEENKETITACNEQREAQPELIRMNRTGWRKGKCCWKHQEKGWHWNYSSGDHYQSWLQTLQLSCRLLFFISLTLFFSSRTKLNSAARRSGLKKVFESILILTKTSLVGAMSLTNYSTQLSGQNFWRFISPEQRCSEGWRESLHTNSRSHQT